MRGASGPNLSWILTFYYMHLHAYPYTLYRHGIQSAKSTNGFVHACTVFLLLVHKRWLLLLLLLLYILYHSSILATC